MVVQAVQLFTTAVRSFSPNSQNKSLRTSTHNQAFSLFVNESEFARFQVGVSWALDDSSIARSMPFKHKSSTIFRIPYRAG